MILQPLHHLPHLVGIIRFRLVVGGGNALAVTVKNYVRREMMHLQVILHRFLLGGGQIVVDVVFSGEIVFNNGAAPSLHCATVAKIKVCNGQVSKSLMQRVCKIF